MSKNPLSFEGRLARGSFWLAMLLLLVSFFVVVQGIEAIAGEKAALVVYLPLFAFGFVLCVRRLHDRERSAWTLLALAIPVLGPLWIAIELLRRGTMGDNRFGADPLADSGDYLTVA